MGFIRTFLAIAVVIGHSTPVFGYFGVPPEVAVRIFFIVSGFYMSLILSEKYLGSSGVRAFYVGRFLRIYPIYYAALVLMVLAYFGTRFSSSEVIKGWDFVESRGVSLSEGILWVLPNLTLFGSDIPFLFHHDIDHGVFFSFGLPDTAFPEAIRISPSILNGPAWTLGIELWFYLLVPFIARARNVTLVVLTITSLSILIFLEIQQPWSSYFFFPSNLCFFLIGMIAQRVCRSGGYRRFHARLPPNFVIAIGVVTVSLLMLRQFIPLYRNQGWIAYVLFAACLPVLFTVTKSSKIDRWIGGLSYPIYILHAPVLLILGAYAGATTGGLALPVTLGISILVVQFVDRPLEEWRQNRVRNILACAKS